MACPPEHFRFFISMQIEYARFIATPVFVHRAGPDNHYIPPFAEELTQAYFTYEEQILHEASKRHDDYLIKKEVFDSKKCHYCGGRMKYIPGYDFWGCSNYKEPGDHSTLSGKEPFLM